MNDINFETIS